MARRLSLLVCVVIVLAGSAADGATLIVPEDFPTIQSGINAASNGDTVLVRVGTYQEMLNWANKDLTLLGDDLSSDVVITGDSTSRVMNVGPGVTEQTVIENLTIRDGLAEEGAGIKLVGASPTIQKCRFEANVAARPTGPSHGGALFVDSGSSPLVRECSFIRNESIGSDPMIEWWGEGGAIYVQSDGFLDIRRCGFEENAARGFYEGGLGGGIRLNEQANAAIDSCGFIGNFGGGGGVSSNGQVAVRNCTFQGNHGWSGAALSTQGTCQVQNSQFFANFVHGTEGGTIDVQGNGEITNNTIAFNESHQRNAGISVVDGVVVGNIICQNIGWGVVYCPPNPSDFRCNDVWGNTVSGAPANYRICDDMTGLNGNISADPLFCDASSHDYRVMPESPCAPEHSPPGCGLIGALPVCGVTAVEGGYTALTVVHLSVQPNPAKGVAEFVLEGDARSCSIEIYNGAGRLVDVIGPMAPRMRWALQRNMSSGVYFARLRGDGVKEVVKFVVLR